MKQEYVILQKSKNSYKRCKALINIIKRDFGEEVIYMCTPIEKAKEEILKCFNNIFKYISWLNHIDETEKVYHFYRMSCFTNTDDELYKHFIDFGGFNQVLMQGNDILNASIILLDNSTEEHLIKCFDISHENDAYDIIDESIDAMKDTYLDEDNDAINEIINEFWMNTIEFDYAEFKLNRVE